jgi:hypothetical protein
MWCCAPCDENPAASPSGLVLRLIKPSTFSNLHQTAGITALLLYCIVKSYSTSILHHPGGVNQMVKPGANPYYSFSTHEAPTVDLLSRPGRLQRSRSPSQIESQNPQFSAPNSSSGPPESIPHSLSVLLPAVTPASKPRRCR